MEDAQREERRVKLDKERVEQIVNTAESAIEAAEELYRLVGIDLEDDKIDTVDPKEIKVTKETNEKIMGLFFKNHKRFYGDKSGEIMRGGIWFNSGWSNYYDDSLKIEDWEAVLLSQAVKYKGR